MLIHQSKITKLEAHLGSLAQGQEIVIATPIPVGDSEVRKIGFPSQEVGLAVLPSAHHGPACRFNAEGKFILHRDQPRDEPYYREVHWHWTERHGDHEVERDDFKEIMRFRYRRTFVPPPSIEVRITQSLQGHSVITSGRFVWGVDSPEIIKCNINMMLELFGVCQVLDRDLNGLFFGEVRRVNWRMIPEGPLPWERLKPFLTEIIAMEKPGNREVIERRFELLNELGAERIILGQAGFAGYVVFHFPRRGYYVFESVRTDNATYFFGSDWEELSKMTKAEILAGSRYQHRVIHRAESWRAQMMELLGRPAPAA